MGKEIQIFYPPETSKYCQFFYSVTIYLNTYYKDHNRYNFQTKEPWLVGWAKLELFILKAKATDYELIEM